MHFMSIEVSAQQFLFKPSKKGVSSSVIEQRIEMNEKTTSPVPFSHNHLHDLESLWWVAVYMVVYNHFSKSQPLDDKPPIDLTQLQLRPARVLFPPILNSGSRIVCFRDSFKKECSELPSDKQVICKYLDGLRQLLIQDYEILESSLPQSIDLNSSTNLIYEDFKALLSAVKNRFSGFVLEFIPKIVQGLIEEEKTEKQARSAVGINK
jgi:hypothetical protein